MRRRLFNLDESFRLEGELDDYDRAMIACRMDKDDDAHDGPLLAMLEMMPA